MKEKDIFISGFILSWRQEDVGFLSMTASPFHIPLTSSIFLYIRHTLSETCQVLQAHAFSHDDFLLTLEVFLFFCLRAER